MIKPRRLIPRDVIEAQLPDDDRETQLFLPAVAVKIVGPVAHVEAPRLDTDRISWTVALLAEQAGRFEHRQRAVAPLLMLFALGLLFVAGWSC